MNRRSALKSAIGVAAASAAPSLAAPAKPVIFELRYFRMRNSAENQVGRTTDFLKNFFMPAALRAGAGPVGFFAPMVGESSPFILSLRAYTSLSQMETTWERLGADNDYRKGIDAYTGSAGLGYLRIETQLYRAFEGFPSVLVPSTEGGRGPRLFELRTYESNNFRTLRKKIGMFQNGEIDIFKKTGINPVFFGEMLFGPTQPCLTYMAWYENMATREKAWATFIADPDWQKLRATPGLSDAEVVSNISNLFLRPLPFSQIR